ncbi:phosphoribosylglycinamide formyltransferase [bacterium]|nr:MAG: phosphoribosylglycinamide formyltransferase [bacterium]
MKIAVFASGRGTNFSAILKASRKNIFKAKIALLICDNPKAPVLRKAKLGKIKSILVNRQNYPSRESFEEEIIKHLKNENIGLIVLAGFMRMLSPEFVRKYKNRIMNIHPSLLPSFKGAQGIKDAFDYGVKITGVTVHFVDEHVDHGPVILQESLKIRNNETLTSLEKRIHQTEHQLYPQAIKLFTLDKLKTTKRRIKIL